MKNSRKIVSEMIINFYFIIIFILSFSSEEDSHFIMYPSYNKNTSYLIHSYTPNSEFLTIDLSEEDVDKIIKKRNIEDYTNSFSSIIFYEKDYLIKTCFSSNKIIEIIPLEEADKNPDEIQNKYSYSEQGLQISDNLKYCYSTIVSNPDTSKIKDENIIVTYWVQNSAGNYMHKTIFFYPETKKFSKVYNIYSNTLFPISKRYPIGCTTFRSRDIFCSYYDLELNNQYVIETHKIIYESALKPAAHFVLGDFGQIKGKNMVPITLNRQIKSIFGGYYDVFLAKFSEKKDTNDNKDNTLVLFSLYRKSLYASIVPMFAKLDLYYGINIRDEYIENNLFNYILQGNEMMFIFISNNMLYAIRIDYSLGDNIFAFNKYTDFHGFGYYSSKLPNCKNPKFIQSTYINTTIKYTEEEKMINKNIKIPYILKKDIVTVISCSDDDKNNNNITYIPKVLEVPQCLIDLDDLNSHEIHKINFYLNIKSITYDIYDDIRLKSFRNVGIKFYDIEKNYEGLIYYEIKLRNKDEFIKPDTSLIYYDITHIKFIRIRERYVPYFTKQFHLKYRLYNVESEDTNTINKLSSNICFFQIKFFPYNLKIYNDKDAPSLNNNSFYFTSDFVPQTEEENNENNNPTEDIKENEIEPDDVCNINECSLCKMTLYKNNYNGFICEKCDASEVQVMIPDNNIKSETYGACICDIEYGFKKDPILSTCFCQDDYAYYKSTNLCKSLNVLENGPYYIKSIDDISEIPIYDDCYSSCAKCNESGNYTNHNCLKCKEGFVYIDDDTSNCYNKSTLGDGYHEVDKDKYIKCHDNCISCTEKPKDDKQFCTECRSNVSYYIRENPSDVYFNCFSEKCDLKKPESLLYAYDINSHECLKDCNNGVQPFNDDRVCLMQCDNEYPYLDEEEKKCYEKCEQNDKNKITDINKGLCINEENCDNIKNNICSECDNEKEYKNKEGKCLPIPEECLVVNSDDVGGGKCKICNEWYYPLKEDLMKESFNCYKNLDEITKVKNRSNYYLNETEGYWDECYESCETCYAYGSENRQRCIKCKEHYHLQIYINQEYNNCALDLIPNDNCTSSQIDMYKYKDFCHLCKEGYAFYEGFDKCLLEKELQNGPYYSQNVPMATGDKREKTIIVKIYYNCYKYCKTCSSKGDLYDNKCDSCIDNYIFNPKSNFKNCISIFDIQTQAIDTTDKGDASNMVKSDEIKKQSSDSNDNYENESDEDINESDLIQDSEENIWFNLGNNSFYIYQQGNCLVVFYYQKIILISDKETCLNICPQWNIDSCPLKKYNRFKSISKENFTNLINSAYIYSELKNDISILIPEEEQKIYFHITNNVSPSPKNLSSIDISEYDSIIRKNYGNNLLLVKADLKRKDTQSTQVEYQLFNPNNFKEKINLGKLISNNRRRLNDENSINDNVKINIDLPVDWTEEQLENINYLNSQNINAFDSSSDFYIDNCYQFTSLKGSDVYLKERKNNYYPDIPICEQGCTFVKYNSDTEKVTCNCNYKINSDNYTQVTFVKNSKNEKFLKDTILENLQSMKCTKVIFKSENLKSNAGFFLMIIFLIIFISSSILYYFYGGSKSLDDFVQKASKDENIINILKSSQDFQEEPGGDGPDGNKKIPFNGGPNNGSKGNKGKIKIGFEPSEGLPDKFNYSDDSYVSGYRPDKNDISEQAPNNDDINNKSIISKGTNNGDKKDEKPKDKKNEGEARPEPNKDDKNKIGDDKSNEGTNSNKIDNKTDDGDKREPSKKQSLISNNDDNNDNKDINGNKNKQGDKEEGEEERTEEENNGDSGNDGKEVIKKKDKKKRTKREKDPKNFSIIEDVQKPENYGKDNSVISGSKIGGDMISNITSELSDAQKLNKSKSKFKQKSLISRDSKEKKDDEDEEEISMGNMSNIKQNLFGDESKNDEDILNVMNGKDNNDNNNNDDPNKNKKNDDDNDIDVNLKINNIIDNKEDNNDEKDGKKDDDKNNDDNDANKIEINDIKDNNDEDKSELEEPAKKKGKNKKVKIKETEKSKNKNDKPNKKLDVSHITKFSQLKQQKEEGFYDNDSNIYRDDISQISKNNDIFDLVSENSSKPNPPKFGEKSEKENPKMNLQEFPKIENNENQNQIKFGLSSGILTSKVQIIGKNSSQNSDIVESNNKINSSSNKEILVKNDELMSLKEFSKKYPHIFSIYLADIKKHHLIYYTFSSPKKDSNIFFLKLSLFSISIILYFFLNTIFMVNSQMANIYYSTEKSSPICALINLFLPFIICGIIILLIKKYIMPNNYIVEIIKSIQSGEKIKKITGFNKEEESDKNKIPPKTKKKRKLKNKKNMGLKESIEFENEKSALEVNNLKLLQKYKKIVIIYFLVGFIFLGFNWYLMTSYCSIYKNSGFKLILNGFMSLLASLVFPFILGIIPTLIATLAVKIKNKLIFKVYKFINKVI